MDSSGRIYQSDDVSPKDEARLDGYLRGRADEAELLRLEQERVAWKQLAAIEARERGER